MKKFLKKSDRSKPPTEKQVEEAVWVLRAEYYSEVRNTAWDLMERVQNGEIGSAEGFSEALDETVDGDRQVFITWEARKGLLSSDNQDAYFEELGETLECEGSVPYEKLMYYAYRADIAQFISAMVEHDDWPDPTDEATY